MGAALRAGREVARLAVAEPWMLVAPLLATALAPVLAVAAGIVPVVGGIVYGLVVHPLLIGGLLHVGDAAVEGSLDAWDFFTGAAANFLGLLGASVIVGVVYLILGVLGVGIAFAAGFTATVGADTVIGLVAVAGAILGLGFQFVDVSVVVDDEGPTDAVERSWEAVVHNPVSALSYGIVRLLSLGLVAVAVVVFLVGSEFLLETGRITDLQTLVIAVVLGGVGYFGGGIVHAVFYRQLTRQES